jgi:hypothetical protein
VSICVSIAFSLRCAQEAEAARNAYNASAAVAALKHSNRNPNAMGIGSTALDDNKVTTSSVETCEDLGLTVLFK